MNTPAINNPLGVLPAASTNSKQDALSSSEAGAFNQVLSREIADRNNAGSQTNEVTKSAQKDAPNTSEKMKSEAKNESSDTTAKETAKTTDEDKAAAVADGTKDELDAEPVTASAEMLAFIASLTQANTAATPATTDALAANEAETKIGATDTALDTTLGASEKDAIGKKSEFVAALDKATTNASDSNKIPVEVSDTNKTPVLLASTTVQNLNAAQATQAAQTGKLLPQVGKAGWDQALGQKVVWMAQGAQQIATLTLNPPDLGPLQVTLNVSNNQATANFTAAQPEVRHALEAAMPRLREMLNEAGIQLGQSSVSAGTPNQQNAFAEQRQNGRQSGQNGNAVDPAIHVSHVPVSSAGTGIVDTFA